MTEQLPHEPQPESVLATITDIRCQATLYQGRTIGEITVDILEAHFPERDSYAVILLRDASEREVDLDVYHPITITRTTPNGEQSCQKWPLGMVNSLEEAYAQLSQMEQTPELYPDLIPES